MSTSETTELQEQENRPMTPHHDPRLLISETWAKAIMSRIEQIPKSLVALLYTQYELGHGIAFAVEMNQPERR